MFYYYHLFLDITTSIVIYVFTYLHRYIRAISSHPCVYYLSVLRSAKHLTVQGQQLPINRTAKLRSPFYGPYKIKRWVGPATLELDIPSNVWPKKSGRAYFPVSRVKPYHELEARELRKAGLAKILSKSDFQEGVQYEVEHILGHRNGLGAKAEFLVRWTGFDPEDMQFVKKSEVQATAPKRLADYIKHQRAIHSGAAGKPDFASVEDFVQKLGESDDE